MGNPRAIMNNPEPVKRGRSHPEQSRTCKYWDMGNPGAIMSNPEPVKNWDMGNPGAIPSNPGLVNIGTQAIPEPS